jgi:hypothetical protein
VPLRLWRVLVWFFGQLWLSGDTKVAGTRQIGELKACYIQKHGFRNDEAPQHKRPKGKIS